ncbi:hypothetical protein HYALB_00002449 [Hymenoscyphus albidus]|uniref:Uncharacterized protein n=1 Tax=Hymenoscyphus albidus TaxID=595503 RepID=A0A9N9LQ86_9HELO|nr:hypothetical protein HYALB_00002449 [Hymenoscyphus albidus]
MNGHVKREGGRVNTQKELTPLDMPDMEAKNEWKSRMRIQLTVKALPETMVEKKCHYSASVANGSMEDCQEL